MRLVHLVAGRLSETAGDPPAGLLEQAVATAAGAAVPPLAARIAALHALADALAAASPALAAHAVTEIGTPIAQAPALHVGSAVGVLRAMAELAASHRFRETRTAARGGQVVVMRRPVGIGLGIVPWNVPLYLACAKLGAALAAGAPIILKPSPENAGMMADFAAMIAALPLPAGVVQLVIGGRDTGAALVADARIAKISFTGSTAAGRAIAVAAAPRLARLTLELGGKSAAILLDDFDPDTAADELFLAMLQNNGQVCGAQSRVLVPAARSAYFVDWLAALFDRLAVGDAGDPGTQIGPLATLAQAQRVRTLVAAGEAQGARRLGGAPAPDHPRFAAAGLYAATPSNVLAREEVFGPASVVIPYTSEAEAIRLANDSEYGLSGSVWSADPGRAVQIAEGLHTGTIGIASRRILDFNAPFGGWRQSGLGRELGPEGIDAWLETTTIIQPHHKAGPQPAHH